MSCRLWHSSQNNFCQRCQREAHKANNYLPCEVYVHECDGVLYKSYKKTLSNYFPCTLNVDNNMFCSSEQYYQHLKCMKVICVDTVKKAWYMEGALQWMHNVLKVKALNRGHHFWMLRLTLRDYLKLQGMLSGVLVLISNLLPILILIFTEKVRDECITKDVIRIQSTSTNLNNIS